MNAEIICVGTEILLGNIVNTNSAYLSEKLSELGINLYYHVTVGDNASRLADAVKLSARRSDLVILTGGLGPTYDDITKETTAAAFGKKMYLDGESLERIKEYFRNSGRAMTDNNIKQAYIIEDATVLPNDNGTAPGMVFTTAFEGKDVTCAILPGPPPELTLMFERYLRPILARKSGKIFRSHTVRIFGIGESKVESDLRALMETSLDPTVAPYAKCGEVELRLTSASASKNEADEKIFPYVEKIKAMYGKNAYGTDVCGIEEALLARLRALGKTVAFAESCTGGLVAHRFTAIPGASDALGLSVVSYSAGAKIKALGVFPETIKAHGTVSAECAREMADGVLKLAGADVAVSVTGVAGPSESEGKPVGLVYIGVAAKGTPTRAVELHLARGRTPKRETVQMLAASHALFEALSALD